MRTERRVVSRDGTALAVYESGHPSRPTVVAVHGYPDNHAVWDDVAARLSEHYHVIAYDVRGAGASDKPSAVASYRLSRLIDDLRAVVDAVSPEASVHLLAHDWGSVQCWPALTDPRTSGRICSFTSISGPALDHAAVWLRQVRSHPRTTLRQVRHSAYVALFQLPGLPEFFARRGLMERAIRAAQRRAGADGPVAAAHPRDVADMVNGVALYRANMFTSAVRRPRPVRTPIPVQVIAPEKDAYVTPPLALEAPRPWVEHLTTRTVPGGHWVVSEDPDRIARLTHEFVQSLVAARGGSRKSG